MKPTEYIAETLPTKTGLFATLHGSPTPQGSGAPSRTSLVVLALLLTLAATMALCSTPASAAISHTYLSQLTGFGEPGAVAFDAAGDVYVVDIAARTVDRFDSSGAPLPFSASGSYVDGSKLTGTPSESFKVPDGVAVTDETGEVYVADRAARVVDVYSSTGQYLSQLTGTPVGAPVNGPFHGPEGLTIDQSTHNLYVADLFREVVDVFSSSGAYLSQFGAGVIGAYELSGSIAVNDLTENSYVADPRQNVVYVFDSTGGFVPPEWRGASTPSKTFGGSGEVNVGLDHTTHHVYVAASGQHSVDEFDASASEEYLGRLTGTPSGRFSSSRTVAINPSTGDLYVADQRDVGVIDVFGPDIIVPDPAVQAPSGVSQTTATLNGSVNPAGVQVTSCAFEYGASTSYGQSAPCDQTPVQIGAGNSPVTVTATPSGLQPNTTYHYRLNAANANGAANTNGDGISNDETFITPGPPTIDGESAEINSTQKAGQTEATLHAQITPGGRETTYRFEYGETSSYGTSVPGLPGALGSGEQSVSVPPAELINLKVGTTYHYRVVAVNEYGTIDGLDQKFTTLPAALIDSESISDVAATSATLGAQINPLGSDTNAYFQYGTVSCTTSPVSCTDVPLPPGIDIGSVETDQTLSVHLQGLTPATTYHYRVVAGNALGSVDGESRSFTTQPPGAGLGLPDGRQWELVTPPNKHGAVILPREGGSFHATGVTQAAEDGSGIVYRTDAPTEPEPPGYGAMGNFADSVLSMRGAAGWSTRDIATPHNSPTNVVGTAEYLSFAGDLSAALAKPEGEDLTLLSSEASEPTPYIRREALCDSPATAHECYWPVLTGKEGVADVPPGTEFGPVPPEGGGTGVHTPRVDVAGVSPDLRHVLLKARHGLALTATPVPQAETSEGGQIYEWTAGVPGGEALQLVSTLPASEGGGPASAEEVAVGGGTAEFYGPHAEGARHAVSNDGSRVFWEARDDSQRMRRLYLRDTLRRETVRLDVPQPGAPSGGTPFARFEIASTDGSKVFFTDEQRLTIDSGARIGGPDLYECEIVEQAGRLACSLKDLTPAREGHSADVRNMVSGAAEDGSSVYFVANGVLNESKNSEGESAAQGTCVREDPANANRACNLYEYHQGAVTFIATLSHRDENAWGIENSPPPGGLPNPQYVHSLTAYASPDGRYLTFMSFRSLTGYDNHDAISGKPDAEVYLYDAARGRLSCASCNPTGARPHGIEAAEFGLEGKTRTHVENLASVILDDTGVEGIHSWVAANLPPGDKLGLFEGGRNQPRPLSDGGRVFFNSSDALVPQDVNGNEDVYEFEPEGTGSCTASSVTFSLSSGGCVSLISSGTSPEESGFLDASKSGSDVFFLTNSSLVAGDTDTSRDVYDAHVCSASAPCPAATVTVPGCATGDACRGAPSPQPSIFGAPASATFAGAGNVASVPSVPGVTGRRLTRAQQLARALRACHKKPRQKRAACVRQARKRFGAVKAGGSVRATRKARG